jgi:hypothetical protein
MAMPILWKKISTDDVCNILLNVIFLYLSEEPKDNLKNQGIDLFVEQPLSI